MLRFAIVMILLGGLTACAGTPTSREAPVSDASPSSSAPGDHQQAPRAQPAIYTPAERLECVPYARTEANIEIYGDAWTWWDSAHGRYARGSQPRSGSIIALEVKPGKRGHLAVVREVAGARTVIADHANWLNEGRIHLNTPIVDVSPDNDWSAVRVWYTPGNHLGGTVYRVQGFIYPEQSPAELRTASSD